ncbi:hypothetical protein Tco_0213334 [Tanacetum coccineum]
MVNLKFADTHNMVAFLSKPTESEGFEQIVDFLNEQPIRYALMVNPTIYISCIEQFWSTGVVKTINGEVQLHALVDGKKVIISEASVRKDLKLEYEEGIDCLPNFTIFEQLTLMGSKTTALNEFSSIMAFAIICLATNQKFNFSKYIFESMVRNLDNLSGKILMYPRFVQVFLEQQLGDLSTHNRIYIAPSHTKKIFGNMRMVGKGFFGRVTPLFPTMVVQNQFELGDGSAMPTNPHHISTIIESSTQPQKTQKPRKPKRKDTQVPQPSGPTEHVADEVVHKELGDSLVRDATTAFSLEAEQDSGLRMYLNFPMIHYSQEKVLDLEKTKTTQANEISSLKRSVKKLEQKKRSRTHGLKRLYKVGLTTRVESSSDEEDLGEDASKQGRRINAIDADEDIILVNVQDDADNEMFDVNALNGEEVFVAGQNENVVEEIVDAAQVSTAATTVTITTKEITLAQALAELKSTKPKSKGIVLQEPGESTTTTTISSKGLSQDNGKGILVEPEKPLKKKDQPKLDEEMSLKLQAEIDEEERIARAEEEKIDEANIAWDDIQANVDQKVDEDKDTTKLQSLMEVIPDEEEVAIDDVPLATKSPSIGRIVGIKSLLNVASITAALIDVNAAQSKLVLLENFNENYSKCLRLLVKLQLPVQSYYCLKIYYCLKLRLLEELLLLV